MIEIILALIAAALAALWPALGARWFSAIENELARLARRKRWAVFVVGASTLLLRLAVLPVEPVPHPLVHDEYAYLLQADTFAHGRLTNPTPDMWQHFETFHVLFQPTYCAKFFPAQGLFLALGKAVFGDPFWGVWLTSGLMCAAIVWMLQGWFDPEWALLGGVLALLRFGIFGYWANSYWGGNVAAIGGALVLGALPRIRSLPRVRDAIFMGIGAALLANSRPWEGFALCFAVAAVVICWWWNRRPPLRIFVRRVGAPLALILSLTAAWLAYYCWRTTGNPLRLPYQVYEQTYGALPFMVWQKVRPIPQYRHDILRQFNLGEEGKLYADFKSSRQHIARIYTAMSFYLGPALLLPFIGLVLTVRNRLLWRDLVPRGRALVAMLLFSWAAAELAVFYNPHYSAPITALILALVLLAMQALRRWNKSGLFLSRAVPVICVLVFALRAVAVPLHISIRRTHPYGWYQAQKLPRGWAARFPVEQQLNSIPGNHLVIVRYGPDHDIDSDWVYNEADIDHARIIWARDMGENQNRQLIDHFPDRSVWLAEPDSVPVQLTQYHKTN